MEQPDAFLYRRSEFVDKITVEFRPNHGVGSDPFSIPLGEKNELTFDLETLRTLRYELDTAEAAYFEEHPELVEWDNLPSSWRAGLEEPTNGG